jgi:trimethylguanosine synthase
LDYESWYSVTPEEIAKRHASRLQTDIVLDAFCGAGGNTIQLAMTCHRVIALDMDPNKLAMAQNNASIYGVADRIEFICGDYFEVIPALKERGEAIDAIFLSPPWGGLDYRKLNGAGTSAFNRMMGVGGRGIFALAASITPNIAFYVPRCTRDIDLQNCAIHHSSVPEWCEIETNFLGRRATAKTAYYGDLAETKI